MIATTMARKPRRVRDAQESRRLLVEAAAQIFNSDGFHGTDTNRIAKAAGYTPGTFYTHFPDQRAIFLPNSSSRAQILENVWRKRSSIITRSGGPSAQACVLFMRSIRKSGLRA